MATANDLLTRARGVLGLSSLLATLLALAVFSTAGCGDDASSSGTPDAAERDGDPGSPADAMRPIDAPERPDADPNAPDAGPRSCGGFAGEVCDPREYCDYPDNQCGGNDATGECKIRPDLCQPVVDEVCGCDGRTYPTQCEAEMAGTDIASEEPC